MTTPLSRLSDEELQERLIRFGDLGMELDRRFDETGDPADWAEARRCWDACCAMTREMLWRSLVAKPAANDPPRSRA